MLRVGLIGGGKMACCMLEGLLVGGDMDRDNISVSCRTEESRVALQRRFAGVRVTLDSQQVANLSDIVVFCVKQKDLDSVVCKGGASDKCYISIISGMTMDDFGRLYGISVVRVMPSILCSIRRSVTVIARGSVGEAGAVRFFLNLGSVRLMDEDLMDAVTVVTGSGPAFVSIILQALVDGALLVGISRQDALPMVMDTIRGTMDLIMQGEMGPEGVVEMVATPGGCTIAGILAMEEGGLRAALMKCIQSAMAHIRQKGATIK